ncbi:hypothetical protein [Alkalibacterium sp. 20]|uniref:hypothetical protein n=1 Tax=Alkalibacterium sp. 20 TaxID=1798803 RepID=UPI0008FFE231|nr:hypothetical protein [Alkalibacterium sp. 20]OJF96177.1 hypothetical protein AX762_05440 [Alkalibacterium sp. 20]
MARIDNKVVPKSLKDALDKEAVTRNISLNQLTTEILENYIEKKYSFESEKRFTDSMNNVSIAINKNTEILEKYIEANNKMLNILLE